MWPLKVREEADKVSQRILRSVVMDADLDRTLRTIIIPKRQISTSRYITTPATGFTCITLHLSS